MVNDSVTLRAPLLLEQKNARPEGPTRPRAVHMTDLLSEDARDRTLIRLRSAVGSLRRFVSDVMAGAAARERRSGTDRENQRYGANDRKKTRLHVNLLACER
jgi:hypothetical protein